MFSMPCMLKNKVFDNIFFVLLASRDKSSKDNIKSKKDLALYFIHKELKLTIDREIVCTPKVTYSFVRSNVKLV